MLEFNEYCDEYNFSVERKRIMNPPKKEASFDDNVKQHKSIDVYGRDDDESNNRGEGKDEESEVLQSEIDRLANM
jgi:hypothetical protein